MEKLTDFRYIRALMEEQGITFKKKFGQNFLTNEGVLSRIAENADRGVLEIGPGIGSLTQKICERAEKVVACEIDRDLIPILDKTLADFDNVEVINEDIMKVNLPALIAEKFGDMPVSVCANLPYYITTPVIMLLLESEVKFTSITVMIQKEVAARLCAGAGSADYGAVTAAVSYYAKAERLFTVSAGNFLPAPKVDSAVVRLTPYEKPPVEVNDSALMFRVIAAAFGMRRKTLVNALSGTFPNLTKAQLGYVIEGMGLARDVRGEKLSIAEFARLSDELGKQSAK